ncbi:MAG: Fpg/Nei family DNA glycosylase [Acidimicrobiia bacterium]|nr:Fpg/Nei family DNA glycosylase [Acidimicrobiia bacterium]
MPELPEVQALAERLDAALAGRTLAAVEPLGFAALKTVDPPPAALVGRRAASVGRRGKYLVLDLGGPRLLVHLSQAGRVDVEDPPKRTRPRGAVARFRFDEGPALLVREHGTERKAAWWVLAEGDEGPLAKLGPEPGSDAFAELILHGDDRRRVHTLLRDQRTVAGIGRGYADDALHRAGVSPYATLASLAPERRRVLLDAVRGPWRTRWRPSAPAPVDSRPPASATASPSTGAPGSRAPGAARRCGACPTSPTR